MSFAKFLHPEPPCLSDLSIVDIGAGTRPMPPSGPRTSTDSRSPSELGPRLLRWLVAVVSLFGLPHYRLALALLFPHLLPLLGPLVLQPLLLIRLFVRRLLRPRRLCVGSVTRFV